MAADRSAVRPLNVHYDLCIGGGCHLGHGSVPERWSPRVITASREAASGGGDFMAVGGNHYPAQIPGLRLRSQTARAWVCRQ